MFQQHDPCVSTQQSLVPMPKRLKLAPTFDTARFPSVARTEAGVQTDHVFFYKAANSERPLCGLTAFNVNNCSAAQTGTARLLPFQSNKPSAQQTAEAYDSVVTPASEDGSIAPPHPGDLVIRRQRRSPRKRKRRHTLGSCIDLTQSDDEEGGTMESGVLQAGGPPEAPTELREGLRATPARAEAKRWSRLEGRVCNFPDDDGESIAIHGEEVRCLAPGAFLNDTIIEFYMRWLQVNWPRSDLPLDSCLFLNSFFYKKLKQLTTAQRLRRHPDGPDFQRLRRWTKGIDLLAKQYIFVPIHDSDHWTLAVICFPEESVLALPGAQAGPASIATPAILHLDSLGTKHGGHATSSVTRQLKSYLAWEVLQQLAPHAEPAPSFSSGAQAGTRSHKPLANARPAFTADQILVKRVPVPLQQNDFDCGLFLLHSLETFVTTAPATFRLADLTSTLQLGRTWYPSESASLRRLDLLRMLERLFGLEELSDEAEDAGTAEVEFMGSGAAGQAAAQKQLELQPVGPPLERSESAPIPVEAAAPPPFCNGSSPPGEVTGPDGNASPAAAPSLSGASLIQSSDPVGAINPSTPTGCLSGVETVPSAQTSRSAQSPPELVNGPAAARVDAHLGYSPGPSLIRTEPDALLTGGLGSADVIFSERGRGVEDQVPAGVCLPLEVPEPVSSVQGSGLLEGAPQETYETPSVGPVVDPGPANVNSPADVSNGKLDAHSSPPLRNTAMPEAGLYGCTEERKRAEGAVETATESGGGIEAAETGECAPHGQSPTEDGGDDNKMDVERGTDLRKTELSPKAEGAMGTAPQEAGEREAAGTGEASPLEQSPAEVGGDAMDVDAGRSTDMRQAGPGARAGTRDGCLATGTNGGSESQTNTITNGSADSEWPLGRADGRQLEAGGKKGGYVSDVGAVRTVAQPFLPSKPGNSLSAAPEAAPGPESVETLCQLYISNLIATTLRKELQERLVQMDGAEERFLSEAVDGGPGARGSGSREALAGATDPSLLFPLIPEPELPGPPIAATFANASSLLRAEHGDAAETGAPRCAPELKSGHQQVGDRNQGTKDGGLAGPVGSATEGAVDPVAGGKSLTDMEIKGARAPRETALQATPPMRVDEQELAASPPQETGNVEILPEVGRNGKAADSSNPTHGAGLRQRGVRDATWLGAKQEGGSQQLADWALNSGRKNENSSQAENPEAGAQCGAKNRDLAETGVEGGAKTESTGAGRHTKGVLDAFETFGAASMTEERNFQPGRYVEESTKVSTSQVRGSEVDQRSGNDFLRGFGAVSSGTQPIKEALQEEGTEKGSARDGGEIVVDRLPTGETADGDASRGVEGDEFKNGTGPDSTEDDYTVGLVVGSENWIDWVLSRPEEAFS